MSDTSADVLAAHGLTLSPVMADVLRLATAVYAADTRLERDAAFDRWTRHIELSLPVSDPALWDGAHGEAVAMLRFLTGDHWEIGFRPHPEGFAPAPRRAIEDQPLRIDAVSLFSGGLDSYIGAVDELEKGLRVALVGHHAQGTGATSSSQASCIAALRSHYDTTAIPFLQLWVSPAKGPKASSEASTRSRSLLFIALGLSVAVAASAKTLVVPENGFISLNVPLTNSRLGSLSTRTTHPHFIALVRQLLDALGVTVELVLPYRFRTKGEMVSTCSNQDLLRRTATLTMSCSHPESNRFRARDPSAHCGRCFPCLIRRAALAKTSDETKYVQADLSSPLSGKSGEDLRALKLALDRYSRKAPGMVDVLAAGPLPGRDDEKAAYVEVFRRGLEEVRSFLRRYDRGA
jgi:7-cyano-7-deazaguanine synthase in queuosine biosynthesis